MRSQAICLAFAKATTCPCLVTPGSCLGSRGRCSVIRGFRVFFRDDLCSIRAIDWDNKKFDFRESFRNTSSYRGFRGSFANLARPASEVAHTVNKWMMEASQARLCWGFDTTHPVKELPIVFLCLHVVPRMQLQKSSWTSLRVRFSEAYPRNSGLS